MLYTLKNCDNFQCQVIQVLFCHKILNLPNSFCYSLLWQLGLAIRAATVGHIPPVSFVTVTMGSTAVLLIGWRTLLFNILPDDRKKKNDVYKRGSPFELFEVMVLL